jgi:class 3 adenylate cyclase
LTEPPQRAGQPHGTVTFLFSDIEGSTRLLQALGTRSYADVLERHRTLLRQAFGERGGYEVDCEGDQFFVAFQHADDAVFAAAEAQQFLAREPWPSGCAVRVRIGLHTGDALPAPPKYVGLAVHTAARIMAAAHGGQILVSQTTRESCSAVLPAHAVMRDLGEHRLRDIPQPVRLHQLVVSGLPDTFPPPRTLTTRPRGARRRPALALLAAAAALLLLVPGSVPGKPVHVGSVRVVTGTNVLYTTDADFARGTPVGVDAGARGQLGLTGSGGKRRLLWLTRDFDRSASSCTLVKIDTDTAAVRGEYRMVSEGDYCNSDEGWNFALIAVAPDGSAWHARTYADPALPRDPGLGAAGELDHRVVSGRPTLVGLVELDQCEDRNGNGRIETSEGLRDILPWPGPDSRVEDATDECILEHLDPSDHGVGGADRFLGVDPDGRLWLQDADGRSLRFDPATDAARRVAGAMPCDADCLSGRGGRKAVTPDGDIWRGSPYPGARAGLHHTGGTLGDRNTWPTAIAVDAEGNVWMHEGLRGQVRRVDPTAGPLACRGTGCGSGRRLGAFDLTLPLPSRHNVAGIVGSMTTEQPLPVPTAGTWTVVQDGSTPGRAWGRVRWNGEAEGSVPPDSSLVVEARAADAVAELETQQYERIANGERFSVAGRFIEVRASFRRSSGGETVVLSDIRVQTADNASPVAVDDALPTDRSTPETVRVLANDWDPDDDPLSVREWTNGAHGIVRCTPVGACTYEPAPDYVGRDAFTYEVSDGRGGDDTARVAVTVVNRAPMGVG